MSVDVPTIHSVKNADKIEVSVYGGHEIPTTGRYKVLGTHGVGTIDDHFFVTSPKDLSTALNGYCDTPERLGSSIKGALTIYVKDQFDNSIYILTDPFGSSIVYWWKQSGEVFSSSSLADLIAVLSSHGKSIKKSLVYSALLASSNNGGICSSPYEDIESIDQFCFLSFSTMGAQSREYTTAKNVFSIIDQSETSRRALRTLVITDIVNNIKAASRFNTSDYICHLTGGMDSRTVLAALINSGCQGKYSLHCGGDPLNNDMIIARKLANLLELEICTYSGLHFDSLPESPAEDSRWSMHETSGVLRGPANVGLRESNALVLSGGFGGLLRSSFGVTVPIEGNTNFSGIDVLKPMLGSLGPASPGAASVLNTDMIDLTKSVIDKSVIKSQEFGIPNDALPEYLWFSFRSRYYVGEISRSLSKYVNRFDPLYTPWLLPLAWSYRREDRVNNYAHLDLLCDLNRTLAMIPFDKNRITDQYLKDRPEIGRLALPERMSDLVPGVARARPLSSANNKMKISQEHYATARKVGLPPATVAYSSFYQTEARRLVGEIGENVLSEAFNYRELCNLLERPLKWRPQYRAVRDLHDALAWYVS